MSVRSSSNDSSQSRQGHRQLLLALLEGLGSDTGGEVIVRSGRESGRIHVTGGKIAWVSVSTVRETFSETLTKRGLVGGSDLRAVLEDCRKTGANFAELIVGWGLVSADVMREEFFRHTVNCLLETFRLPDVQSIFAPIKRSYRGSLLFTIEELLDAIVVAAPAFSPLLSQRWPQEPVHDFLERVELGMLGTENEGSQPPPFDLNVLGNLSGLLAVSVTNGEGRVGSRGSFEGISAEVVTPRLDLILAAANHATARSGLGNVVGLWIGASEGMAVVQEFSGGAGLVRCIFERNSKPALVRIQLEKILSTQDAMA